MKESIFPWAFTDIDCFCVCSDTCCMFTGKYDEKPEYSYLLNVLLIIMPFLSLDRGVELLLSGELGLNGLYIPLPSYLNKGKGYQLLVRGIVQPFVIDQWRNTFSPV